MSVAVASALPVAVSIPSVAAGAKAANDPIFGLIEQHRQMVTTINATGWENDEDLDEACEEERALHGELAEARPITLAGAVALLRYMIFAECGDGLSDVPDYFEAFLNHIATEIERVGVCHV